MFFFVELRFIELTIISLECFVVMFKVRGSSIPMKLFSVFNVVTVERKIGTLRFCSDNIGRLVGMSGSLSEIMGGELP